jgi:limonene 1,2-monooxygenase
MVVASTISPSGMTLAGKYGTGVISIGSTSTEGLAALATQWSFAEESAAKHGNTVDRKDWRVLLSWHIAETREQARKEAGPGCMRWHNEYVARHADAPRLQVLQDARRGGRRDRLRRRARHRSSARPTT